ncbi:MAG: ISNCY family transposase [Bacteroidales bacterium]|nr:ISNCY family transposase [Bacteroidales bacterium]
MQLRNKQIRKKLWELDKFILNDYRKRSEEQRKEIDSAKYEIEFKRRIKKAIKILKPITDEATIGLRVYRGKGNKSCLKPNEKLRLILIHQLFGKSNRMMSNALLLFSLMTGVDVSYKTIERLYSDEEVEIALFNLLVILLKKKDINKIDACGDATGYSLIISKHYSSEVQKLKDKAKEQEAKSKKKAFVYKFALMDLKTRMYVCFGTSLISEAKAFAKAMQMLEELEIKINSIRLDRYYSFPCYVSMFKEAKVYIIPRKNSKLGHGDEWLETMKNFVLDTMNYLKEYFQRVNSENGFAQDKKLFGWRVSQKIEERIDTALFCRVIWHDLINLFRS